MWFDEGDPLSARLVDAYRSEYGFEPFSYLVPRYRSGHEDEHPYYFMPPPTKRLKALDAVNFEHQLVCGHPLPGIRVELLSDCGIDVAHSECLEFRSELLTRELRGLPDPKDAMAYVVPMGRVVGKLGETAVRIVVKGCELITAYPVFP